MTNPGPPGQIFFPGEQADETETKSPIPKTLVGANLAGVVAGVVGANAGVVGANAGVVGAVV